MLGDGVRFLDMRDVALCRLTMTSRNVDFGAISAALQIRTEDAKGKNAKN